MQELVQNYYQVLSAGGESVELIYVSHLADGSLSQLAQSSISRDRASGRTHKGVHRDVVTCLIDGKDARVFGSQGQKKSFIFAIKLAQLNFMQDQMADQPILLLDDIFDRLDHDRVERLLHIILNDSFGQIFITDTQWERFNQILTSFTVSPTKIEIL
jgi:DNA replication and repair protein RecF